MMTQAKILYVEDDVTLAFLTRDNLERAGYNITYCEDGLLAMEQILKNTYDLYVLDIMLPKIDGYMLAKKIRQKTENAPIIFLSAKSTIDDKIAGLQIGADDYITKPFSIEELILKIEVFLKRSQVINANEKQNLWQIGHFTFLKNELKLKYKEEEYALTFREAELLECLCKNQGKIAKRDDILNTVWGSDRFFSSRSLDVFVSRLRKLLKSDKGIKIENIHNIGYRLVVE